MKNPYLFFIIATSHLLFIISSSYSFEHISKVLLLPTLFLFFFYNKSSLPSSFVSIISFALLFSFLGDVLLIFADAKESFFLFGLASFFLAHLFYIIGFFLLISFRKAHFYFNPLIFTLSLIFLLLIIAVLYPKLPSHLIIPVVSYGLIITTMFFVSSGLKYTFKFSRNYTFLVVGTALFILSDTLIALNKFYMYIPFNSLLIMTTYILAQFLIVTSFVRLGRTI